MPTDPVLRLLIEFFDLPPDTPATALNQQAVPVWDSLAMIQLITELQGRFGVEFALEEIEALRSYEEIRATLEKKGKLTGV